MVPGPGPSAGAAGGSAAGRLGADPPAARLKSGRAAGPGRHSWRTLAPPDRAASREVPTRWIEGGSGTLRPRRAARHHPFVVHPKELDHCWSVFVPGYSVADPPGIGQYMMW